MSYQVRQIALEGRSVRNKLFLTNHCSVEFLNCKAASICDLIKSHNLFVLGQKTMPSCTDPYW